nr:hypothetical protein [Tanacetum cinerariifolium]
AHRRFQARPRLRRAARSVLAKRASRETHWRNPDACAGVHGLRTPAGRHWRCFRRLARSRPEKWFRGRLSGAGRFGPA